MKMKKNKLLIISAASCLGLSLIGAGVGLALQKAPAKGGEVLQDATLPEDAIGARVKLGVDDGATDLTETPAIDAKLGLLVKDGETAGTKDVRIYAKLNTVAGVTSAYITRKVTAQDGTEVKAEKTMAVGYAYSSLKGNPEIKWYDTTGEAPELDEAATADSPYYIVYTLKDIPEDHLLDLLEVQVGVEAGATNSSATITCNAVGIEGDQAVNCKFIALTAEGYEGEYGAYKDTDLTGPVVIPENYYTYAGPVATCMGKVTALSEKADLTGSNGAFEYYSSITSFTLPATIKYFDSFCFSGCSAITELTLPRDLVTISSSSIRASGIKTVNYDAVNLTTVSSFFEQSDLVFNVSADVESLPKALVSAAGSVKQVNYGGTTAEWEALKTEDNAGNGLFIDNVICSDTVLHTVTWHIGEGAIGELTGDYESTVIGGKTAEAPGNPKLTGKRFKGWYLDPEGTTPWDPEAAVNDDLDLYAIYEDFGPGVSAENPYEITTTGQMSFEMVEGFDKVYLTYTHPADAAEDWRYLYVDDDLSEASDDSPTKWLYTKISVYEGTFDEANLIADVGEDTLDDDSTVQEVGNDGGIRFKAEPGKTYCLLVDPLGDTTYYDTWYGNLVVKFADHDNDDPATCQTIAKGDEVEVRQDNYDSASPAVLYKYEAGTNESLALTVGRTCWSDVTIYDVTDPANVTSVGDNRGTSDSTIILDAEAGHTYIIAVSFNDPTTDEEHATLLIGDAPAGSTMGNPAPITLGEAVTTSLLNGHSEYRTVTVEEGDYAFLLEGGSDSYAKYFVVYDAEGTEVIAKTVEEGTSSGWYGSTYGGELLSRAHLAAGTYTIEIGYNTTSSTSTMFQFTMSQVADGDYIGRPLAVDMEASATGTYAAKADGFFLTYTPTAAADGKYLVVTLAEGNESAELHFVDAEGNELLSTAMSGKVGTKLTAGEAVYLKIDGADGDVTLTWVLQDTYEDGQTRDTAYDVTDGIAEAGEANIDYLIAQDAGNYWFKFTVAETGTYTVYSKSTNIDMSLRGVYAEGSEEKLDMVGDDDDGGAHSYTTYRYDFAWEMQLEAGVTYYAQAYIGWHSADSTGLYLGAKLAGPGELVSLAIETDWLAGQPVALAGSEAGIHYKDVAEADGYYTISLDEAATGSAKVLLNGTEKLTLAPGDEQFVKVVTGDELIVKVVGEGEQTITAVYSTSVEDGTSAANAYSANEGANDITSLQDSSRRDVVWFKFTASTTGLYKIYSNSINGTADYGLDAKIYGVYDSPEAGATALSLVDSQGAEDDNNRHPETIYKWDFYVTVNLTAGTTYYLKLKIPAASKTYGLSLNIEPAAIS